MRHASDTPCDCDETYGFSIDVAGRTWANCRSCERQWVIRDAGARAEEPSYARPNTGNHPDHPPVPGGYRGDK